MYDPRAIANAIYEFGLERGLTFTNLQMQKFVYLAHGYFLRATGKPLSTESFEAWDFGPVSRTLYNSLKTLGDEKMLRRIEGFDPIRRRSVLIREVSDPTAKEAVRRVVDIYGMWSAFDLVQLTHSFGSPWSRAMEQAVSRANLGMKIEDDLIINYFEGLEPDDHVEEAN